MNKQHIVRQLARQLTDEVLLDIFPTAAPQSIRDILLDNESDAGQDSSTRDDTAGKKLSAGCQVFTDGASRGNPGPAGAGVVLLDEQGHELCTRAEFLGKCTNNVAEYQALILGLRTAQKIGCTKPAIFLDSELIVRQVRGIYKVKNATLKPLFTEVRRLLQGFDSYTITHVPRARNSRADELANRGIDERQGSGTRD